MKKVVFENGIIFFRACYNCYSKPFSIEKKVLNERRGRSRTAYLHGLSTEGSKIVIKLEFYINYTHRGDRNFEHINLSYSKTNLPVVEINLRQCLPLYVV